MKSLKITRRRTVGIEVTRTGIHVAVLASSNPSEVLATTSIDAQVDEWWQADSISLIQEGLSEFVNKYRLKGAGVILGVPNERVILRYLKMPSLPEKVLRQAIEIDLGSTIHLPFEDPVFDVVKVPPVEAIETNSDTQSVCLVAAPGDVVRILSDVAKNSGLKPLAVDIVPLALWRTKMVDRQRGNQPNGMYVLLHVLPEETTISLFLNDCMYLFRHLDRGFTGRHGTMETFASDVGHEIQRVLNFFSFNLSGRESSLASVVLQCAVDESAYLAQGIGLRLNTRVIVLESDVTWKGADDVRQAVYNPAIGLACKEVTAR